ncbi:hypothetical protein EJ08DRAFT_587120 [Tothia fuscella]|uniref:Secreted protein n=1 Tax=Tothia fuscella TaxID=1048955 RepID=A0A9P4NT03_9PEZI|nr:hypothetical protein EJ08DRAFT_587120 [Tothia fuscella]
MRSYIPYVVLSSALVQATTFRPQDAPPGTQLLNVVFNGNGCPTGGATSWSSTLNGTLSFLTPELKATSGRDIPRAERRKVCQANFSVAYPTGWQFGVKRVRWSGYADLASGVSAVATGFVYFSGETDDKIWVMNLDGELHKGYTAAYEPASASDVSWSACSGREAALNVKVESRFEKPSDNSLSSITIDEFDTQIQWRQC